MRSEARSQTFLVQGSPPLFDANHISFHFSHSLPPLDSFIGEPVSHCVGGCNDDLKRPLIMAIFSGSQTKASLHHFDLSSAQHLVSKGVYGSSYTPPRPWLECVCSPTRCSRLRAKGQLILRLKVLQINYCAKLQHPCLQHLTQTKLILALNIAHTFLLQVACFNPHGSPEVPFFPPLLFLLLLHCFFSACRLVGSGAVYAHTPSLLNHPFQLTVASARDALTVKQ